MTRVFALMTAAAIVACGPRDDATPADPDIAAVEETRTDPAAAPDPAPDDIPALLAAIDLDPDAEGRVLNACDESVAPRVAAIDLGAALAGARSVTIPGGPQAPTCYGDGPGAVYLVTPGADGPRVAILHQGYIAILESETDGVRDIALGGRGFTFPVLAWDGSGYARTGRTIDDAELGAATFVP